MFVKKAGGKVFGAHLTAAEHKALDIEINKQLAVNTRKFEMEIDALILWELHEQLGLGATRLHRFYAGYAPAINKLLTHYEMGIEEAPWLATQALKEIGVDIEQWYNEKYDD